MSAKFDVAVIGSGFGGSVAALRLVEKGYRVVVIEAGARFEDHEFAKNSFDLKRFLFFPRLGMRGIQRIDMLRNVLVMSGAGVGGGSLVYANTLYRPPVSFYKTGPWAKITNWQKALEPYFDQAERMLGVETNPFVSPSDVALKQLAERTGRGKTFRLAELGIYFGKKGERAADPYFGGKGPERTGCLNCGECMTGCRHGAKNTLVKNYLYLAEQAGVEIRAMTTVDDIEESEQGYKLSLRQSTGFGVVDRIEVEQVVVAAGALGTAKLLHKVRNRGHLQGISKKLGELSRTNSESLLGVVARDESVDFSLGAAITASYYPTDDTHIENVRYGRGSGFMGLLESVMASGKNGEPPTPWRLLTLTVKNIHRLPSLYNLRTWPQRTLILLVMQARDNSLTTYFKRGLLGRAKISSKQGYGEENPAWVAEGHKAARELAKDINGDAGAVIGEPFGIPLTAHFLGGAVIAPSENEGVVDAYLRVFGQAGLHIFDGSTLSANPGVNPSLSITAQAEWAAAHWPNKGEKDPRPLLGSKYKDVSPVEPKNPVVPKRAKGALRLPLRVK